MLPTGRRHGNYECGVDELVRFHSRRIAVLADTDADFLAFESIPSLEEAKTILAALQHRPDLPAYISFTCQGVEDARFPWRNTAGGALNC